MKKLFSIVLILSLGLVNIMANEVDPKIASSKKSVDTSLSKIEDIAKAGKVKQFPSICAKVNSYILKYTFPNAPLEVKEYYDNALNICYGKLHILALQARLKQEGKTVCASTEVKLQTRRFKSYLKKTNDIAIWDNFMVDYKKTCPNNLNF